MTQNFRKAPQVQLCGVALNQFNQSLFSTLDLLLPTEFLGKYDVVSNINDYYSAQAEKYGKALEESTADRSKVTQLGADLLANTASAAPNAMLALMSGGTTTVGQGTTAGLQAASAAGNSSGILSAVGKAARQVVKKPTYWSSVVQTLGNEYEAAKTNGASELQAIGSAYTSSLLNAGIEAGGGVETLPGTLRSGRINPVLAWGKSALSEGAEEAAQSMVSGLTQKLLYDKNRDYFSLVDESAVVNPNRMGREFAMGTAVGGVLGAGQVLGSVRIPTYQQGNSNTIIEQYRQGLQELQRQKAMEELNAAYEKNVGSASEISDESTYTDWLRSVGAEEAPLNTLEKYSEAKYNNSPEYQLLSGYGRAVEKGDISPLVGFAEYEHTNKLLQESIVGLKTVSDIEIESFTTHFIDRVIGQTSTAHSNMRCGVEIADIMDALQNPLDVGPIRVMEDGDVRQKVYGARASVVLSVRDNRLIQTNPIGG